MILAILAVFFAGMALGGFLFAYKSEPMQIASDCIIATRGYDFRKGQVSIRSVYADYGTQWQ